MLAILLELVVCLAVGAAAAWFITSTTQMFLIVFAAVTVGLGVVIFLTRHMSIGELLTASNFWL